jgi:DNA-binding transcriptional MerR regulator
MAGVAAATMSIGEAANRTGLSPYTLRYYEREGLLAGPVPRSESGHRIYAETHIEWLMACKRLRAAGMPLRAIARFVNLAKTGPATEAERLSLLRDHQHDLTAEIAELSSRLAHISNKIGIYEGRSVQDGFAAACADRPDEDA